MDPELAASADDCDYVDHQRDFWQGTCEDVRCARGGEGKAPLRCACNGMYHDLHGGVMIS